MSGHNLMTLQSTKICFDILCFIIVCLNLRKLPEEKEKEIKILVL